MAILRGPDNVPEQYWPARYGPAQDNEPVAEEAQPNREESARSVAAAIRAELVA